jgi:hypothetical protein
MYNWREIWKVLHSRELNLISLEDAMFSLALLGLSEIEAACLLYIVAVDGYIVKRYF